MKTAAVASASSVVRSGSSSDRQQSAGTSSGKGSTFIDFYASPHIDDCQSLRDDQGAILARVDERDAAAELERAIERYNDAWNAHDVSAIVAQHAPGMVFENHTAGERVEGDAVAGHIARIFESWPDLTFTGRRLYVRDGLAVSEWTARATDGDGRRLEWDGVDLFPFDGGLILRKDVYSSSHRPRVLDE